MSLVGRLDVKKGDLIMLEDKRFGIQRIGFVSDYAMQTVTLDNANQYAPNGQELAKRFLSNNYGWKSAVIELEYFDSYEVLRKYNASNAIPVTESIVPSNTPLTPIKGPEIPNSKPTEPSPVPTKESEVAPNDGEGIVLKEGTKNPTGRPGTRVVGRRSTDKPA